MGNIEDIPITCKTPNFKNSLAISSEWQAFINTRSILTSAFFISLIMSIIWVFNNNSFFPFFPSTINASRSPCPPKWKTAQPCSSTFLKDSLLANCPQIWSYFPDFSAILMKLSYSFEMSRGGKARGGYYFGPTISYRYWAFKNTKRGFFIS